MNDTQSREKLLHEALEASEAVLRLHLDVISSLPFSMSEIEPSYEEMLERRQLALSALRNENG